MKVPLFAALGVLLHTTYAFQPEYAAAKGPQLLSSTTVLSLSSENADEPVEKYRNKVTELLANFLPEQDGNSEKEDPLGFIDFTQPKLAANLDLDTLAAVLDAELYEKEWFVTGNVNPIYFSDSFRFQDPDVKIEGIEEYARGVCKLFDQETSRAEIISTVVNSTVPNTITCTWRLSGKVNIGPGLEIKPYIVYTDLTVDSESGLIVFQEDRFSTPGWDILLSAVFPFLIGKVTSAPAPQLEPRVVPKPDISKLSTGSDASDSPFDKLKQLLNL